MRHHSNKRKFGREKDGRNALLKSLAENLVLRGKITTTLARAKELRPYVEKLITKSRSRGTSKVRESDSKLYTKKAAMSVTTRATGAYATRSGGYTRIVKLPNRRSDSSKMAVIEFV